MSTELKAILDALLESRAIMEAKLDGVSRRLDAMDARLDAMDARLDAMDARLGTVESKLDTVAADVSIIKGQVGDLHARTLYLMRKAGELEGEIDVLHQKLEKTPTER